MPTDFENNYKDIAETELWKIFVKKSEDEKLPDEFKIAVGKVCKFGIDKAKDIIRFFSNFTLHDVIHIRNVCNWMTMLLGKRKYEISAREAAMLLMSACCHDIGMSVSEEQKKSLAEKAGKTDKEQREYVRKHHHERIVEHITSDEWDDNFDDDSSLEDHDISYEDFIALCQSHGQSLDDIKMPDNLDYDFGICAVLLRLADILDLDSKRAPQSLYEHMGIDSPVDFEMAISKLEWLQNRSGKFSINQDNNIVFKAKFKDPNLEHKVKDYLKWVEKELVACKDYLKKYQGKWQEVKIPFIIEQNIKHKGYDDGDFKITMNQDRIIKLLTGENLYSDTCVFVRELLQNSIDAILWRGVVDPNFNAKDDGIIIITTWYDENGQGWFRIEDNGTGMDERMIRKYFLTAGNSYYVSDDFDKERDDYAGNQTYKPISRFGIGILSCFMSDEKNKLEISTKRYSQDRRKDNAGVRLSVTGLKGYYTLAKEKQEYSADWQKMPRNGDEPEMCYRNEPGTTICVGMNLFSLGDYRNIKEVLDTYVKFPEIKVVYNGPEGHNYQYKTKDDFLQAVDALKKEHGDTNPIVCTHPIPEEDFKKLKELFPQFEFESIPELVLSYFPLDKFTSGNNLCGVFFNISIKTNCKQWILGYGDKSYVLYLRTYIEFSKNKNKLDIIYRIDGIDKYKIKEFERIADEYKVEISFDIISDIISESEKNVMKMVIRSNHIVSRGFIAYNGVFAGDFAFNYVDDFVPMIILLSGDYAPDVNVARNKITKVPVECAFELDSMKNHIKALGTYHNYFTNTYSLEYQYLTEKELYELIEKHPEWEQDILIKVIYNQAEYRDSTISEIKEAFDNGELLEIGFLNSSLYDNITLAFLKKYFKLCVCDNRIKLADKADGTFGTSDFPIQLFFEFSENLNIFGKISRFSNCCYSFKHSFSKWLIMNREKLQRELPKLYDKILEIMIKSSDKSKVIKEVNSRLKQLEKYKNNVFGVTEELYLTDSDFD